MKIKALALASVAVAALATATPADAHGFGWGGFAAGAVIGGLFAGAFAPHYAYGYSYPLNYNPYFYAPPVPFVAPTVIVPSPWPVQPDPVTRHVQYGLNMLGYGPLAVDGVMGPSTYSALVGFQANNGLSADGIAGLATLAVLDHQLSLHTPPPPVEHPPAKEAAPT